jgi:hypothetical protein
MAYTKIRLAAALRAYRNLHNDRGDQTPAHSQTQAALTNYQFRKRCQEPSARDFRAPINEDSDGDDEDFNPSEKKRKKQPADRKAPKRKSSNSNNEDDPPTRELKLETAASSKPRPSTEVEVRSKDAFLTLKITLNDNRKTLGFRTHIDMFKTEHSDILKHNDTTPREWEAHVRKQNLRTVEDQFMDEAKERGATDGRMLRNKKVIDISGAVKSKKRKAAENEQAEVKASQPTDDLQRPTFKAAKKSKYTRGLPSPSSTLPGN